MLLQLVPVGSSIVRKVTAFLLHGPAITLSTVRTATMNEIAVRRQLVL